MSLLLLSLLLFLLWWNTLLWLLFHLLHWHTAEGTFHPCSRHVRQGELSHLSGVLGLYRILENRLGDQMLEVLLHSLHHCLLLSVIVLIPRSPCRHCYSIIVSCLYLKIFFYILIMLWNVLHYPLKVHHPDPPPMPLLLVSSRSCGVSACCCRTQPSQSV